MSDAITMDVHFSGLLANADDVAKEWHTKITAKYLDAANNTLTGSQADAPQGATGDLRAGGGFGETELAGPGQFHVDITYENGTQTAHTYSYSPGDATTKYADGNLDADGYVWFVELGHMSRAGNPVPPQPFLGPNFDMNAEGLLMMLEDMLS